MPTSGPGAARAPPPAARSLPYQAPHGIPAPTPTEAELGLARYKARHKLRAAQKASGITAHTAADEAARLCARQPKRSRPPLRPARPVGPPDGVLSSDSDPGLPDPGSADGGSDPDRPASPPARRRPRVNSLVHNIDTGAYEERSSASATDPSGTSSSDTDLEPPPRAPPAGRTKDGVRQLTLYQFATEQPNGVGRGRSFVVRLNDPPAGGTVLGLDRVNQAVDTKRVSRQGNNTSNPRMMGDWTVKLHLTDRRPGVGDTRLDSRKPTVQEQRLAGPNVAVYAEALIVDRIRETDFTASGRELRWELAADRCTFPRKGVLTFTANFDFFDGVVEYYGGRKEWWFGTRSRHIGKRHPYGVFAQIPNVSISPAEALRMPFPPVNGQFASVPDVRPPVHVQDPDPSKRRTLDGITALFCHTAVGKIRKHRDQSFATAVALRAAWIQLQIGTGTADSPQFGPDDPQPLNLKSPELADILAGRPEWIVLTSDDQLVGTRGRHWDLSALLEDGSGTITEIVPGTPVLQFLNVAGIQRHAKRLLFKDQSAISQHASTLGSDDHCMMWRHPLRTYTGSTQHPLPTDAVDLRDWVTSLADHHDGCATYLHSLYWT